MASTQTVSPAENKQQQTTTNNNTMIDHSVLFPPMAASHSGLQQIVRCLSVGTPQIRQMLLQETDVILECKACRSLFRSVINLVDHKRKYCTKELRQEAPPLQSMNLKGLNLNLQEIYSRESEEAVYVEPEGVDDEDTDGCHGSQPTRGKSRERRKSAYVVLRSIPTTSKALEQQVLTSNQILTRADIDEMSQFGHQEEYTASKLIGEIAMKQVKNRRKSSVLEKRQTLHNLIKNQISPSQSEADFELDLPEDSNMTTAVPSPIKSPVQKPTKSPEATSNRTKVAPPRKSPAVAKEPKTKDAKKPPERTQAPLSGSKSDNVCKICRKRCKNWTALAWHMRIHTRPFFKCSVCQYKAVSVFNLKRHLQQSHHFSKDLVDRMLNPSVQKGGKSSSRSPQQTSELSTEGNIPTCNICLKTFASRRNVMRHMQIHKRGGAGREKHASAVASKGKPKEQSQMSKEDLAWMKVVQIMDEKRLMCRKCNKSLSSMRRLHQHVCNHFGLNRYRCKSCPYENSDYTQMRRHIMGKHGRQFRTIQQISGAIKSMKVGIWINFAQFENSANTIESPSKKAPVKDEKVSRTEAEADSSCEEDDDDEAGNADDSRGMSDEGPESPGADTSSESITCSQKTNIKEEAPKVGKTASEDVPTSITPQSSPQVTPKKNSNTTEVTQREGGTTKRQLRASVSPKTPPAHLGTPTRGHPGGGSGGGGTWGENDKVFLEAIMDKKNIRCISCGKQYQYLSSLQRHVRFHLLPSREGHSGAASPAPAKPDMDAAPRKAKAIQALMNENQIKCLKCRKRFSRMSSLKRHVGRHLGYNTFKCHYCGYISRNYTWFKQHLLTKHTEEVEKLDELGPLIGSMKTTKS